MAARHPRGVRRRPRRRWVRDAPARPARRRDPRLLPSAPGSVRGLLRERCGRRLLRRLRRSRVSRGWRRSGPPRRSSRRHGLSGTRDLPGPGSSAWAVAAVGHHRRRPAARTAPAGALRAGWRPQRPSSCSLAAGGLVTVGEAPTAAGRGRGQGSSSAGAALAAAALDAVALSAAAPADRPATSALTGFCVAVGAIGGSRVVRRPRRTRTVRLARRPGSPRPSSLCALLLVGLPRAAVRALDAQMADVARRVEEAGSSAAVDGPLAELVLPEAGRGTSSSRTPGSRRRAEVPRARARGRRRAGRLAVRRPAPRGQRRARAWPVKVVARGRTPCPGPQTSRATPGGDPSARGGRRAPRPTRREAQRTDTPVRRGSAGPRPRAAPPLRRAPSRQVVSAPRGPRGHRGVRLRRGRRRRGPPPRAGRDRSVSWAQPASAGPP